MTDSTKERKAFEEAISHPYPIDKGELYAILVKVLNGRMTDESIVREFFEKAIALLEKTLEELDKLPVVSGKETRK